MDSETNIINEDAVNEEKPVEEGTLDKILSVFGDKGTNLTNMGEKLKEWEEQPLKVILNSVEEAKGFISEWKIHKDAIEVDVCPALTLDEVGAIRRLFQVESADGYLKGDVVKVKLGQYEALQAARNLPELPISAVCSILAAVENGREKAPADVGQGQQKPSVP